MPGSDSIDCTSNQKSGSTAWLWWPRVPHLVSVSSVSSSSSEHSSSDSSSSVTRFTDSPPGPNSNVGNSDAQSQAHPPAHIIRVHKYGPLGFASAAGVLHYVYVCLTHADQSLFDLVNTAVGTAVALGVIAMIAGCRNRTVINNAAPWLGVLVGGLNIALFLSSRSFTDNLTTKLFIGLSVLACLSAIGIGVYDALKPTSNHSLG